jgi:hypothetical protein
MSDNEIISWIFYAVSYAENSSALNMKKISEIADGINHAVPTQKEMTIALDWLMERGFVEKAKKSYTPTVAGRNLVNSARRKSNTTMGVWRALEAEISNV